MEENIKTKNDLLKLAKGYRGMEIQSSNCLVIHFDNMIILQSYNSVIAIKYNNIVFLTYKWNYSKQTAKYRCAFLGENTLETRANIKSGKHIILD